MSDLDPFADQAFVGRLQKLLSMLGSGQPAEAETARLKLIAFLKQHRLSLTDVSLRLGEPPRPRASFTQGARELGLERELAIARAARQEAEVEAATAIARATELQIALQRAAFDVGRALRAEARSRLIAGGGLAVAAAALIYAAWPHPAAPRAPGARVPVAAAPLPPGLAASLRLRPGEHLGQAAVQDLALRLQPNDDADVRAFLNMGEPLVIERRERVGVQTWLYVRSQSAAGYVRSGDVLRY